MVREMKDSGIEWIGEIPKEWRIGKYKYFSESRMGETILAEEVTTEGIPIYSATLDDTIFGYIKTPKLILNKNDFVIPARGNSIGSVTIVKDEQATCTQTTICSRNIKNINIKYLYFCCVGLKEMWFKYEGSAIPQITVSQIKNNILPIPNLQEQEKIANYLDKKVADIDLIIEKTKDTIEDYKKYKQSLITEVVTKGLDPNVEARETDNIHIKFIPKLWEFKKIKYLFTIKKEIAGKKGFDVLSITQKGIKIKDITTNEGQMAMDYSKYQFLNKGDFAMNHMDLLTGWVDISKYDGVTSPDYRVFILNDELNNSKAYYLYLMQMCYSNKIFYGLGQGVSNLGRWRLQADKFLNFSVPVPPLKEQQQIADYLDKKVSEIDNLISKKESLISEMEEYKKSLIYECVTGKKEVI